MSIIDIFKKKDPIPVPVSNEDKMFNPLKGHIGGFIIVDLFEEEGTFEIVDLEEYTRRINGETFLFTDYILKDGDTLKVVRVLKGSEKNPLFLHKMYEGEFDEDILDAAKCKEFNKNDEGKKEVKFFALRGGKEGYEPSVKSAATQKNRELRYWDFSRKPDPELGELSANDIFLFVEVDGSNGWITMWEGPMIDGSQINAIDRAKGDL